MEPTIWQAVPAEELPRIAAELESIYSATDGVLHTSLQQALGSQIAMLRYHAEQAESYNEAADGEDGRLRVEAMIESLKKA